MYVLYACLAGLKPHTADEIDVTRISSKPNELRPERTERKKVSGVGQVSFDDYHAIWSGIATTKPVSDAFNPLSEVLKADSKLQATHFGLPQQELQEEIHKQLSEHNAIMYGKFDSGKTGQDLAELKSTKIQLLKQIYLPKQQGEARVFAFLSAYRCMHCRASLVSSTVPLKSNLLYCSRFLIPV